MAFDTRLLGEREEILLDLRQHWTELAWPIIEPLLIVVIGIGAVASDRAPVIQYITAACLVASLARSIFRFLRWRAINFVLTSERLIYRSGFASKRGLEIPLDRIGTISFEQSFVERLLQRGDLAIEALGDGGVQVFERVPRPKYVQRDIYAAIEADQHAAFVRQAHAASQSPPQTSVPAAASTPYSIPQQIDQLDQLRRRGVITDYEFEAKKQELLDRM